MTAAPLLCTFCKGLPVPPGSTSPCPHPAPCEGIDCIGDRLPRYTAGRLARRLRQRVRIYVGASKHSRPRAYVLADI